MTSVEVTVLTALCFVTVILGVATNGSLLIVFIRSKRLRSVPSNKLICSLLFSDLLIEIGIAATIPITAESLAKKVAFLLPVVSMTITVLNLCSIWVDRIITLKLTFTHQVNIDNKIVNKILIVTWTIGIILAFASAVMLSLQMSTEVYDKWRYVTSIMTAAGFFVLIIANSIIFREARTQSHKIKRQNTRLRRSYQTLQLKSTYLCISMVTAFLIFWLPYLIQNVGVLVHGTAFISQWYSIFSALMITCNTVIHPYIYIFLNKETRKLIVRRWRRSRSKKFTKKPAESQKSLSSVYTISMRRINDD